MRTSELRRGQIHWVDWSPGRGSEQNGRRPALVIQTNEAHRDDRYRLTIVATVSGQGYEDVPAHVAVRPSRLNGLTKDSFVRCEQLMTVTLDRLQGQIGTLENRYMVQVDEALRDVLDLRTKS